MFALQKGLNARAAASRAQIDSLRCIIRVNAFVRLCASISANVDNCFFVLPIETIFMKRERESFQQVISGCEMFMISPLSLLVRRFYIHEQCAVFNYCRCLMYTELIVAKVIFSCASIMKYEYNFQFTLLRKKTIKVYTTRKTIKKTSLCVHTFNVSQKATIYNYYLLSVKPLVWKGSTCFTDVFSSSNSAGAILFH